MTEFFTGFITTNVVATEEAFVKVAERCAAVNAKARALRQPEPAIATLRAVLRLRAEWHASLDRLAQRSARNADVQMRKRLDATRVRGPTGNPPHLRDLIQSRPLNLGGHSYGMVGVARISSLDRAVNPLTPGYGPYWMAQEYGTGSPEVKSQVGRVIRGYFFPSGGAAKNGRGGVPPQGQYRGGGGPHPVFVPGRPGGMPSSVRGGIGPRGGSGGSGVISVEIRARHFLHNGSRTAAVKWEADFRALDAAFGRRLAELLTIPGGSRRR